MMSPRRRADSASLTACRRLQPRCPCLRTLPLADLLAQSGIFEHRRIFAAQLSRDFVEHLLSALDAADQAHHRAVGLILRERLLQQSVRLLGAHPVHQVDRHVVRRRERTAQREGSGGRQTRDLVRLSGLLAWVPEHHGVTLDIDAAAAGPARELGVLAGRQREMLFAVVLHQPLQHHGAGRHVDTQCQCLSGEDGPDQPGGEQLLDGVPNTGSRPA